MVGFDFKGLRESLRGLGSQVRAIRADLEKLRRQRDEVETAPAARADVKNALAAQVEAHAARFRQLLADHLQPLLRKPQALDDPARTAGLFGLLAVTAPGGVPTARGHDLMACGLAEVQVLQSVIDTVNGMAWPAPEGLPMAERVVELARLDKEIAELSAQELQLLADARQAGVVLED